jgi:hypothetical protein
VLENKGSKLFTKKVSSTNEGSLRGSLHDMMNEFPGLDWDYMSDHRTGELYVDVGVSYHPMEKEPLVGLWKLDCLEASFGVAGFNRGTIHNLNTLSIGAVRYGTEAEWDAKVKLDARVGFVGWFLNGWTVGRLDG